MILNEWDDSCAPTDSRRRPDQRKMEDALWDDANSIKLELEERQRDRRKILDSENADRKKKGAQPIQYKPIWFEEQSCPLTDEKVFTYNRLYWEAKQQQEWSNCPDIFNISGDRKAASVKENWPLLVQASRVRDNESRQSDHHGQYTPLSTDS